MLLNAQVSITAVDQPYTQNFNSLASGGGASSTLPTGWALLETGGGANSNYMPDNGSLGTQDTYSYGTGSNAERAFGQLNGATVTSTLGASFTNNTGVTITSLVIQYTGEQWRLGATGRTDQLDFQYSTNATALNNGSWTDVNALDFTAPVTAGALGALDGNLAANQKVQATTITGLSITNGATFWIRWNSFDATGNDDGLSIDDFSMTVNPVLHYTVSNNGVTLSITDTDGNGEALNVTQTGSSIRFYAPGRTYSLNAGPTTAMPVDVAIAGLSFIVINAGTGNDTINVGAFSTSLPGFTINGGIDNDVVNMNGDITFVVNSQFNLNLQNDAGSPGTDKINVAANANLVCSGTGVATVAASEAIVFNSGSSLITANGALTVSSNQQAIATTGDFLGVELNNALLQVTGTGIATILGKGGTTGVNNHGIHMSSGADIIGGTSGTMTIQGTGGLTTGNGNHGLSIIDNGSTISSGGANVSITGTAGGTGSSAFNYGVILSTSAVITTGGTGTLTLTGVGSAGTGGSNYGLYVGTTATITSNSGAVTVTATGGGSGGTGTHNYGVYITNGGKITSGGTGTVTVNGQGGGANGNSNDGVSIWNANSMITSSGGNVSVTGNGGGSGASGSNVGVHLQTSGSIRAGGAGEVSITGFGGFTTGNVNFGVFVIENGTMITSAGGDVQVNGIGGGIGSSNDNFGIVVFQGMITAGGLGSVGLLGTGGGSTGNNNYGIRVSESTGTVTSGGGVVTLQANEGGGTTGYGIVIHNSGSVTTAVNGGTIILAANSMDISSTVTTNGTGTLLITQNTNNTDINLGLATNPVGGPLNLSDAELDVITCGTMFIGNTVSGTLTIADTITRPAITHIGLYSGDGIVFNGGLINTAGGNLLLDPGDSPDAMQLIHAGNDMTCGTWIPVGDVLIDVDGTVADASYTQVNINGIVNLTNAALTWSGTYDPQPGDQFTIILNDGADAVTGTFSGLAEGAVIAAFLGSDLPATISYVGGSGNDVVITVSEPDYIVTLVSNVLTITDFAGNAETMTISHSAPNIRFAVPGRTYSLNGGAVTNLPYDATIAGLTSITVDVANGNDIIDVGAFAVNLPALTLNGGLHDDAVNFNGAITFAANASLNVDLQNDDPSPGTDQVSLTAATSDLACSGNGGVTIRVSRNITFIGGASIITSNGAIVLEANQQATPTTGTFQGINLPGNCIIQATGSGAITLKGKGGTSGGGQHGIVCTNCDIIGGTSGAVILEGIGGATTSGSTDGIRLFTAGTSVSTNGASITMTGTAGGTGASSTSNLGVSVSTSAVVAAGGNGTVTITGNGGVATAINQFGFSMGSGSSITTNNGNILINGYGGNNATAGSALGVSITAGIISAGGAGTVVINGEGGSGGGNNNHGVSMTTSPATIGSAGGSVTVTGTGGGSGTSSDNVGIIVNAGALITAGGAGSLTVYGIGGIASGANNHGIYVSSTTAVIRGTSGTLSVLGEGGGTGASANNIGVRSLGLITSNGTGAVFVQGWGGFGTGTTQHGVSIEGASGIVSSSGGLVQVAGAAGILSATTGNNYGVQIIGGAEIRASGAGNTSVIGFGGGATGINTMSNYGVLVGSASKITSGGTGTVSVTGFGGNGTGIAHAGVIVSGANAFITSSGGNVTVNGTGGGDGASSHNFGTYIQSGGTITAGGSGTVNITGTGGLNTGNYNYGVSVVGINALITSSGGNVTVNGQGGGTGSSLGNIGIDIQQEGGISAGGAGTVTVTGTGGATSGNINYGILVWNDGSFITSANGNVSVTGTAGGGGSSAAFGIGVNIDGAEVSAGGGGGLTITGTGATSTGGFNHGVQITGATALITTDGDGILIIGNAGNVSNSLGILHTLNAEINTASNGGSVHLRANSMDIASAITTDPAYYVWLDPVTNAMDVNLGTVGDINSGPLHLSDAELDLISTGYMLIGSSTTGDITTTADITRPAATSVNLNSADKIIFSVGAINTGGGDLSLVCGAAPDAILAPKSGTDAICNTLYPIGAMEFDIDGLVADVSYTQMNVTGAVNLEDASLQLTGSHIPQAGEQFIIINNDGADPILNTFVGLAEGAVITSFLGGSYPATISYVGGSGNDVVITVSSPNYILTTNNNEIIFTDVAGNGETITMSQSGPSSVQFSVPGRNYSLNGGVITALPVVTSLQNMNAITVNAGGGDDGITVNAFTFIMPALTLNAGIGNDLVNLNGDITFINNANLNMDLQNDDAVPGEDNITISSNANVALAGTGSATLKSSRIINFGNAASLTSVNGNINLEANQQATPTTGTFYGILLSATSLVDITGTGTLDVKGKGGTVSNAQIGVYLFSNAMMRGGTAGNNIISGTGGATTSNDNRGVQVQLNSTISTNGGNLIVNAQGGGTGASAHNHGIHLIQAGVITAGGMGTVTINATGGLPTGIRNHGIHIYGAGSMVTSGGGDVFVYGQSGGTGTSSYNHGVFVELFGMITAGGMGVVTVEGTGGGEAGERNDGVICFQEGATITSGGGDVHVTGVGGGTGASFWNYGVFSDFGGEITAGGMGDLYVTGTGGNTTGTRNTGVYVYQPNASITTSGGDLYITGQGGGSGASTENFGVHVHNGGTIKAGGMGNVFVNGTGGTTTGTRNDGVCIEYDTATISSSGGNVSVIGHGGGTGVAFRNYGVFANETGIITAEGNGNINVQGTGAVCDGIRNYGVVIAVTGSKIISSGGSITVTGQGGGNEAASNNNFGVYLTSGNITAQGDGNIAIDGTGGDAIGVANIGVYVLGTASSIITNNGDIVIEGQGGGVVTSGTNYGVRVDGMIAAGGSGNIDITGYGGPGAGTINYGMFVEGAGAEITTNAGNITLFGQGGGSGNANTQIGVYAGIGAEIIAGGNGMVDITGIAGNNTTGVNNIGVLVTNTGTLISSIGGDISITGQGGGSIGAGTHNYGVNINNNAVVSVGGTGDLHIDGTGGASSGSFNYGVVTWSNGSLLANGNINITGEGGGSGASQGNIGVYVLSQSDIICSGNGTLTINGTGGTTNGNANYGILSTDAGTQIISTAGPVILNGIANGAGTSNISIGIYLTQSTLAGESLQVSGTGGGGSGVTNHGIAISGASTNVYTTGGNISFQGVEGGAPLGYGFLTLDDATITTATDGGDISVTANSMYIDAAINTDAMHIVTLQPFTNGVELHIDTFPDVVGGPILVSDAELDSITTGTLVLGNSGAGDILTATDLTRSATTNVIMISAQDIVTDGGHVDANGGDVFFDPGNTPAAIRPLQYETDVFCSTLFAGGVLAIHVDGIVPDTQYTRLTVVGEVNLANISLVLTGTHVPAFGDTFLIVVNDGVDPIAGTFSGLPEGASIPSFLGSTLTATITYLGGDGNDVEIYLTIPDYLITNNGDHLVITDLSGNSDAMTISENGANIRFAVPGRTYSYNFSPIATLPAEVPLPGIDSVTVNGEAGNDQFQINAFIALFPGLSINGGIGNDMVTFAGDIAFRQDADVNVDLQNDNASPGIDNIIVNGSVNLQLSGTGDLLFKVSRDIVCNLGSSIDTEQGDVIMEANYQVVSTALSFDGISLLDCDITVSDTGAISIKGRAGQSNIANNGVRMDFGTAITGGSLHDVFIEGIGAPSATDGSHGVSMNAAGTIITSDGADVHVTGIAGGINASGNTYGIDLTNGAVISAGGVGEVFVSGTGGAGSGLDNVGVRLWAGSAMITSSGGDITVTGNSAATGGSGQSYGVGVIFTGKIEGVGNAQVTVNGSGALSSGNSNTGVIVSGVNARISSADGDLYVNGDGGGSGAGGTCMGVSVGSNGLITSTGTGDVFVTGNGGFPTGGANYGVTLSQFGTITANGGEVTVTGFGGGSGASSLNPGVAVDGDGIITAGGIGNVFVTGTGGNTTGNTNHGVRVRNPGATITSSGGNVTVIGNAGGSGSSAANIGVFLELAGKITAGNNGVVSVTGTGGVASGINNQGVRVDGTNSFISSANGNVNVNGSGGGSGTGNGNVGVFIVNSGLITAGGTGTVTVTGTGGQSTGSNNSGISLENSGDITSTNGNISVTGTGSVTASGSGHFGVRLMSNSIIVAGGPGTVSVQGTGGAGPGNGNTGVEVTGTGAVISSTGGNVTVDGQGGGSGSSQLNIGVQTIAGGVISAGGAGHVVIDGNGGNPTGNSNFGVAVRGTNTMVTSSGGNIQITGVGGGTGVSSIGYGVVADTGGKIQAGGNGNVLINGTGAMNVSGNAFGVSVSGPVTTITSSGGDVTVNGVGGGVPAAANSIGLSVVNGGIISAGNAGNVMVSGQGGIVSGNNNSGISLQSPGTLITSSGGDVTVNGIGGGVGTAQNNRGVLLFTGAKISAGGAGNVFVTGTGGSGLVSNHTGVYVEGSNTAITSGSGNITVTGVEGASSLGIVLTNHADISTAAMGGDISCIANSMSITAAISTDASGTVLLKPYTNARKIELNNAVDANGSPLRLSDTELDSVFTNNLIIGSAVTDSITIGTAITRTPTTDMELITAGDVIFGGGMINTNGGDLVLAPGITPRSIEPATSGVDATVDVVTFEGDLKVRIDGTTVDAQYQQFRVNGFIDLNSVGLALTGTYTPMDGDSFVIVNNDDVDAIIGTFNSLAEGDTIFNFLGSAFNAVITYAGNTGNDVVLRIPVLCALPDEPLLSASPDTLCEGTQVTLNIIGGNLNGAVEWHWYANACGGIAVGTGNSIMVTPAVTTTYYARGEGGCVTASDCGEVTVVVNQFPDPAIDRETSGPCYYTENTFQPEAPVIPGADYQWHFGVGALPLTATGYGPHDVIYTSGGAKTVKLVIHPNAPGAQCPDSSLLNFNINNCPGQIIGASEDINGDSVGTVNIKLFHDVDLNGMPDPGAPVRNIFTETNSLFALASITPGNYVIVQTQPANYISFDDYDSSEDGDLVPNTDSLDNIIPVTIVPQEIDAGNLFIERHLPGDIHGTVFQDVDMDMIPDPGEGLPAVTVTLYADANTDGVADNSTPVASALTTPQGQYSMLDVPVGHYVLVETNPPGMLSVKDFDASPDGDAVPNSNMNNDTIPVSIANNEVDAGNHFIDAPSGCPLVVINDNDDGPGSLRAILGCALPGETIEFHPSLSGAIIEISSDALIIQNDVIVLSTLSPTVTIQSSINNLFEITPGVQVEMRGLDLISGLSPAGAGAAIDNHGELLLHDVQIYPNPFLPATEYLVRNHIGAHLEISGVTGMHE